MRYKILITFVFFLAITPLVIAQTQDVRINVMGFGKTQMHAVFIIRNTGQVPIKEITILIDGVEYETFSGYLGPGKGIQETILLEPGLHRIKVRTEEGASDSLGITVFEVKEKPFLPTDAVLFSKQNKILIGIVMLTAIVVIVIWLLVKKPKLKLKITH